MDLNKYKKSEQKGTAAKTYISFQGARTNAQGKEIPADKGYGLVMGLRAQGIKVEDLVADLLENLVNEVKAKQKG